MTCRFHFIIITVPWQCRRVLMMNIFRYQSFCPLGFNCINSLKIWLRFVCGSKTLKGVISFFYSWSPQRHSAWGGLFCMWERTRKSLSSSHFFLVFAINSATRSYCFVLYGFGLYLWIYLLNYLKLNVLSRIVSVQKMESVYRLNLLISLHCKSNDTAKI